MTEPGRQAVRARTRARKASIRWTFGRSVGSGIMMASLMSVRRSILRTWRRLRRPTLGRLLWASVALHVVVGLGILAWLAAGVRARPSATSGPPDRGAAPRRAGAAARPARDAEPAAPPGPHPQQRAPRRRHARARAAERGQAARGAARRTPPAPVTRARARDAAARRTDPPAPPVVARAPEPLLRRRRPFPRLRRPGPPAPAASRAAPRSSRRRRRRAGPCRPPAPAAARSSRALGSRRSPFSPVVSSRSWAASTRG